MRRSATALALPGRVVPLRTRPPAAAVNDVDLLRAARHGDNAALCNIFYRHGDRVYRLLRFDSGMDVRSAAAGVRDAFLQVARIPCHQRCTVRGWIMRAALGVGAHAREAPSLGRMDELTPLETRISAMPRGPRFAAVLIERESLSEVEASDALGVPVPIVWQWVGEARCELRPPSLEWRHRRVLGRVGSLVRTGRWCPSFWMLNRAITEELPPRVGWHLSACEDCAREHAILTGVSSRLWGLPRYEMSAALRDEVAVSLLAAPLVR
jgi:DNA-directed RNA polymerase specialized sigma24 family protein